MRSGNTYVAHGAAKMIKEGVAINKTDEIEILFRMDSCTLKKTLLKRSIYCVAGIESRDENNPFWLHL